MGNPYVASKLPYLEKEEPQTNREGGASSGQAWDSSEMVSGYQNKQSKPFSDDSMEKYCLTFANFPKMTISAHCASDTHDAHVPEPIQNIEPVKKTVTQSEVRDELARVYAEEVIALLPQMVRDACVACKNDIDRNTNTHEHDACMYPRKKCIDIFASKGVLLADETMMRDKLSTRLESRHTLFKPEWVNEDRISLLNIKRWLNSVKKTRLRYVVVYILNDCYYYTRVFLYLRVGLYK